MLDAASAGQGGYALTGAGQLRPEEDGRRLTRRWSRRLSLFVRRFFLVAAQRHSVSRHLETLLTL
jgi:hypothetical protein